MSDGRLPVRVYWEDTDAGGVVYHASYLRFMERGRTELLRAKGIDQGALLAESGLSFVVAKMDIGFRSPAKLDDALDVLTELRQVGGASLVLRQAVVRAGQVLVEAGVTCALISREGRPARMPAGLRAKLQS